MRFALTNAFTTSMIMMAGIAVALYAVQVLLRMREEEVRGGLEPVLFRSRASSPSASLGGMFLE